MPGSLAERHDAHQRPGLDEHRGAGQATSRRGSRARARGRRPASRAPRGGRDIRNFLAHAKPIRAHFGNKRALDIKVRDAEAYALLRREAGLTDGTINRELGVLSSSLRLAHRRGLLPSAPPIRRLPGDNVRQGWFARPEVEAVIANLPAVLGDVVRFGYITGWRYGEIVSLTWADVDLDAKEIRLRPEESKNGHPRTI